MFKIDQTRTLDGISITLNEIDGGKAKFNFKKIISKVEINKTSVVKITKLPLPKKVQNDTGNETAGETDDAEPGFFRKIFDRIRNFGTGTPTGGVIGTISGINKGGFIALTVIVVIMFGAYWYIKRQMN